jgi:hypothetical protein
MMKMKPLILLVILVASIGSIVPVAAKQTSAVLYVYIDSSHTTEAPLFGTSEDTYAVIVGETYYIRVLGITQFDLGALLHVKIGWTDIYDHGQTTDFYNVKVKQLGDDLYVDVEWTVPSDAKICTTAAVKYRANDDSPPEYVVKGQVNNIGHMHVVPELPLGTLMAVMASMAAIGLAKNRLKVKQ